MKIGAGQTLLFIGDSITDAGRRRPVGEGDVMDLKPDWLSIMIGTNDVWRQFDRPNDAVPRGSTTTR